MATRALARCGKLRKKAESRLLGRVALDANWTIMDAGPNGMTERCVTLPRRSQATAKRLFALPTQLPSVLALLVIAGAGYCSGANAKEHSIRLPVVEGKDIRFTQLQSEEGLLEGEVNHILQDDQGFMWFGTSDGLRRYDGYGFRDYRHDPKDPNSIRGATVYALFKDRSGRLWVGSDAFLDMFDPTTDKFTHFSGPGTAGIEGMVLDIRQDREGMLWVASYQGLYRVDPTTWQTVHYRHEPNDPSSLSSNLLKSTLEEKDGKIGRAHV